ncbi:Mor transcription activator family protein [Candidatus Thiodictyon syntrophicum]|jgi:Mor family transcriptional regulator|uniref:Mor transcription activator domain-containing protein n=1 Tax=Candidatus Thiodictyon syntrophicum TaxID=1166950 RepID=A0A2K8UE24_9GAMM|nr:Mor transcription activator family protein [Candidatus Thiodictyon syntrophicum]AUB83765.1 hypothetical protein THSYN_24285 [Candidatus Thiodictyon syntrophicum]
MGDLDLESLTDAGRWPGVFEEMTTIIFDTVANTLPHLDPRSTRTCAVNVIARIATEYGGGSLYIPKNDAITRALRNLEIWAEHDGTTNGPHGIRAIAKRYRMSEQSVWMILRHQRQLNHKNNAV